MFGGGYVPVLASFSSCRVDEYRGYDSSFGSMHKQ